MLIQRPSDIQPSDITPPEVFRRRRRFMQVAGSATLGALLGDLARPTASLAAEKHKKPARWPGLASSPLSTDEPQTPYDKATQYNNYYEFGTDKEDPAELAHTLKTRPWSITVEGEAAKSGVYDLEDFLKPARFEERIYRLRCVEAWSMVIPWVGIPMAAVLRRFEPNSRAKYVEFTTLHDPAQMPGQRRSVLDWPYREGLRIDEAMHPLTIFGVGLYGAELPNQNGAPLRLVVPWKYGFKSIKAIVKLRFSESQPATAWNRSAPDEYGFYANVNPTVDHPRWSQKKERRIGDLFKRETLMFNGYAEQVAGLYAGMDLSEDF